MKTHKPITLTAVILLSVIQPALAQWQTKFSGLSTAQRGLYEMSAPDIRNCYATTYDQTDFYHFLNEIVLTHDGGQTWSSVTIDSLENNFMMDIAGSSSRVVHVIGWNSVAGGGNVFRSMDGGATWKRQFTGSRWGLSGVFFTDAKTGWAVGAYGTILHTTTGGEPPAALLPEPAGTTAK